MTLGTQGREGAADVNRRNVAAENDRPELAGARGRVPAPPAQIMADRATQDIRDSFKFTAATLRAPAPAHADILLSARADAAVTHAMPAPVRTGSDKLSRIVTRLTGAIGQGSFDRYFSRQARFDLTDGALEVTVQSEFVAGLLDRRFGAQIRAAASHCEAATREQASHVQAPHAQSPHAQAAHASARALPGSADPESADAAPLSIRFRIDRDAFSDAPLGTPAAGPAPRQAAPRHVARVEAAPRPRRPVGPALRHSLSDFVVGACNRLAYAASLRVAEEKGARSFSPLFLHGTCGLGKTHLLQGLAKRFHELNAGSVIRYTTAETFTNEFITAMKGGQIAAFRRSLRHVDLLCVDDVHFLSSKEATQAELLHTFDALDLGGARVVLASDEHPREIRKLSEQLASRFLSGAVVKLEPPDPETRLKLVKHIGARRHLVLDEQAARLIADRSARSVGALGGFGGSVREIEGLVTQVEAVHRLLPEFASENGVIGLVLVRKALGLSATGQPVSGPDQSPQIRRPIHTEQVLGEVCKALRVDIAELMGRGRHPRVVLARSITAHLSRRLTTMSYPEIARAMNRPNHSTIITACKRLAGAMDRGERPSPTLELGAELTGLTISDLCEHLSARVQRAAGA